MTHIQLKSKYRNLLILCKENFLDNSMSFYNHRDNFILTYSLPKIDYGYNVFSIDANNLIYFDTKKRQKDKIQIPRTKMKTI